MTVYSADVLITDWSAIAFEFSFTTGLSEPSKRIIEKQWLDLLKRLRGDITACPCGIQNFLPAMETDDDGKLICACGTHYAKPLSLVGSKTSILLFDGAKLFNDDVRLDAEVVRNKKNPALWGLKNHSGESWDCVLPNGEEKQIESEKAAPIFVGTSVTIGGEKFEVTE